MRSKEDTMFKLAKTSKRLTLALAGAVALLALGMTPLEQSVAEAEDVKLFVWYEAKTDCEVFPNYPKTGVKGQGLGWTIDAGDSVIWRYNINDTWAVISDPHRAKERFPWWGITRRSCIGESKEQESYPEGVPVPSRILEGRSKVADSGWRTVEFSQGPEPIVRHGVELRKNGTIRDRANFMVGNVFAGWKVDVTGLTRSNGHWVYVYSPGARRWGYIEANKLRD
jgi:hypothetical protein